MNRQDLLARLASPTVWDLAVVGGGATGLGVALDAASRGFRWCCWSRTTSARALRRAPPSWCTAACATWRRATSRWCVRRPARTQRPSAPTPPTWCSPLSFVDAELPPWETPYYGTGLKLYEPSGRQRRTGPTLLLSRRAGTRSACRPRAPTGPPGAASHTATASSTMRGWWWLWCAPRWRGRRALNYCPVTRVLHESGRASGLHCEDRFDRTGEVYGFTVKWECAI